jgi:hypothetical protein
MNTVRLSLFLEILGLLLRGLLLLALMLLAMATPMVVLFWSLLLIRGLGTVSRGRRCLRLDTCCPAKEQS